MWNSSGNAKKARARRSHHGLLDAWLDSLDQLDGPRRRPALVKITADPSDDEARTESAATAFLRRLELHQG
jgi:hypothetical protein